MALDAETIHLTQQFTAGLVMGLCAVTGLPDAAPRSLRIRPHPRHGIDHLRPWFGDVLGIAHDAPLEVDLDDALLDAPIQFGTEVPAALPEDWDVLKGDGSFSHSARVVLDCLSPGTLTLAVLADLAGMSTRSVQRALAAEGTSFRRLLDEARQAKAIQKLATEPGQLGAIAEELGYSQQSALSRAVRRWTGATPARLRSPPSRSRNAQ